MELKFVLAERDHLEEISVGQLIILKWVLIREEGGVECGFKHFKIGTSEGLL